MSDHYTIPIFSLEWFFLNSITVAIISFFLFYGLKFLDTHNQRIKFGYLLGSILFLRLLLFHPYQIHIGIWNLSHSIPLHLCGISAIIGNMTSRIDKTSSRTCLKLNGEA